jgi:hypothetical protein
MKTLTVIRTFTDAREDVLRNIGDVFRAEDERAEQLERLGFVTAEPEEPKTPAPKRQRAKKAKE